MKQGTPGGRTFYLILLALLSAILVMALAHALSVGYQHQYMVAEQKAALETAMVNGSSQIDEFWNNVSTFLFTLNNSSQVRRLYTYPRLPLQEAASIQRQTANALAAFLGDAPYALEAFVSLRNRSYLISGDGVTEMTTYFAHRYQGDVAAFHSLLGEKHAFHLVAMPFPLVEHAPQPIRPAPLALMQTLYDKGHPMGTCVITLDVTALERVFSRYLTVPGTCTLLLNQQPIQGTAFPFAAALPADQQGYVPGVGMVVRRPSPHFPQLSYLLISPEDSLFPQHQGVLSGLMWGLLAITLLMGIVAFLVARRLYRPMGMLMKRLDSPINPRTDECKMILQSFQHLERQQAHTQQEINASSPLVRDALLQHLLLGTASEDQLLMEKYLPTLSMEGQYYVFALAMTFRERETPREGGMSRRQTVLTTFAQAFGPQLLALIPTGEATYALITLPLSRAAHQQLSQVVTRAMEHLENICPGGMVLCASGSGVPEMDWLGRSYQEAMALLTARPASAAYAYLDAPAADLPVPPLPRDCPHMMISLLQGDGPDQVLPYVKELLERLLQAGVSAQGFTKCIALLHGQLMLEAASHTPSHLPLLVEVDLSPLADPKQQMAALMDNLEHLQQLRLRPQAEAMATDMDQVVQYISANYHTPMNLNTTAAHFGYSASYFSRYFKQRMGINFTAYLQRVRMDHACALLRDTALPVQDIALRCGYQHPNTFITAFEKTMGMTPGSFRKVKSS